MGADCFFKMGATHHVCQDYAAAGVQGGRAWAALSDGCSSSPDTDFGARFLVKATVEMPIARPMEILHRANEMLESCGLPGTSLDATLLSVVERESDIETMRAGDGVIVWRYHDGSLMYHQVMFDNSMPRYLSYSLSEMSTTRYEALVPGITVGRGMRAPFGWTSSTTRYALAERPVVDGLVFRKDETDLVLLFSDGVESFLDESGQPVPLERVLDEFVQFKNFNGQFIARRCLRFLKDCAARGWTHSDDFSCAGVYFDSPAPDGGA